MKEIERKFLLKEVPCLDGVDYALIKQGFLISTVEGLLRVRTLVKNQKKHGFLTAKGRGLISRDEYEIEIPYEMAESFLKKCESKIEKTRYYLPIADLLVELDIFEGKLKGLILAEIELENENQNIDLPYWFDKEVTFDSRYANVNLISKGIPN